MNGCVFSMHVWVSPLLFGFRIPFLLIRRCRSARIRTDSCTFQSYLQQLLLLEPPIPCGSSWRNSNTVETNKGEGQIQLPRL